MTKHRPKRWRGCCMMCGLFKNGSPTERMPARDLRRLGGRKRRIGSVRRYVEIES